MDGNGRWATQRGWPRLVGHRKGAERVKEIVNAAPDLGIKWLTIYAFSTENWKRTTEEVLGLMAIFSRYIEREADRMAAESVRMRFIGDRSMLNPRLKRLQTSIEERTSTYSRLNLTVGINYGGRDEITRATRDIARAVAEGRLKPDQITDELISQHLGVGHGAEALCMRGDQALGGDCLAQELPQLVDLARGGLRRFSHDGGWAALLSDCQAGGDTPKRLN